MRHLGQSQPQTVLDIQDIQSWSKVYIHLPSFFCDLTRGTRTALSQKHSWRLIKISICYRSSENGQTCQVKNIHTFISIHSSISFGHFHHSWALLIAVHKVLAGRNSWQNWWSWTKVVGVRVGPLWFLWLTLVAVSKTLFRMDPEMWPAQWEPLRKG